MTDWRDFRNAPPKPDPRPKRVRASTRRHRRERAIKMLTKRDIIAIVRPLVFALDPRCVVCFGEARPDDEMNEVIPRSKTRGKPPEERFNRRICCRVHRSCHQEVTDNRIRLAFLDHALGMDGGLVVQSALTDVAVIYRRDPPRVEPAAPGRAWRHIWMPFDEEGDQPMANTIKKPVKQPKQPQPAPRGNPPVTK